MPRHWGGPYFDPPQLPVDPWGNPYVYYYPGKHNQPTYDLLSVGPDGKEGTDDDIGNWPIQLRTGETDARSRWSN